MNVHFVPSHIINRGYAATRDIAWMVESNGSHVMFNQHPSVQIHTYTLKCVNGTIRHHLSTVADVLTAIARVCVEMSSAVCVYLPSLEVFQELGASTPGS